MCEHLLPRLMMPDLLLKIPFGIFKEVRVSFEEFRHYIKDFCEERRERKRAEARRAGTSRGVGSGCSVGSLTNGRLSEAELRSDKRRGDLVSNLLANNTVLTDDEVFGDIFIFLVAGELQTSPHLPPSLSPFFFSFARRRERERENLTKENSTHRA